MCIMLGCSVALKDDLYCLFPNWFKNFPITIIPIQALLPCKIKVVLHIKGATKTLYENLGFYKLKRPFSSILCPNLMINIISQVFLVYALHLNILSQCVSLEI